MSTNLNRTLLLIDDDNDDTDFFYEAVKSIDKNINCFNAENGKKAIELLDKNNLVPDLIFLDINMPVMGGFECLKNLKNNEKLKNIPVVIYSTSSNTSDIVLAKKLGALSFYVKPYHIKEIRDFFKFIVENINNDLINIIKSHTSSNIFIL